MRKLKIAIHAQPFAPGQTGGTETYFRYLVKHLQRIDPENDYHIFLRKSYIEEIPIQAGNFTKQSIPDQPTIGQKILRRLNRFPDWETHLAEQLGSYGFDLVHFPFAMY